MVDEFRIGQLVAVEAALENKLLCAETTLAKISISYMWLDFPPEVKPEVELYEGQPLQVWYSDENGIHYGDSTLVHLVKMDPVRLAISKPSTWRIEQRRNYYRAAVKLHVTLRAQPFGDPEHLAYAITQRVETVDIGGGGLNLQTPLKLKEGDDVAVSIRLSKTEIVHAEAKVVWIQSENAARTPPSRASLAVQFTNISERDRDHIMAFIFDLQRKRRLTSPPEEP